MTIKWNRESILVILTALMVLIGLFYYGNIYIVESAREEAQALTESVQSQQGLLENYPPSDELFSEYEANYSNTEEVLPRGVKVTDAIVRLEQLAETSNVSIMTISSVSDQQPIEGISEDFAVDTYTVQITSESSANFRELIDHLMNEERVWNISAFNYDKIADENYTGTFNFELYYSTDSEE